MANCGAQRNPRLDGHRRDKHAESVQGKENMRMRHWLNIEVHNIFIVMDIDNETIIPSPFMERGARKAGGGELKE